jgi:flagellar capping protein FliD
MVQFPHDMKNIFVLSLLISFTLICSCQKQDSVTEQLAQRKTELDTRETALDEREKDLSLRETALKERENALAKKERAAANVRTTAPDAQSQDAIRDAAQAKAERDAKIQQLPPEIRAMIPDPSQINAARAEKDRMAQEQLAETQRRREQAHSQKQARVKGSGGAVFPAPAVSSPAVEDASPTPASPVEDASPSASPTPE